MSTRPDSIRNPSEATAITAMVVAMGPSNTDCSQYRAAQIGLEGG